MELVFIGASPPPCCEHAAGVAGRGAGGPSQAALASSNFDGAPCGGGAWLAQSGQVLVGFF